MISYPKEKFNFVWAFEFPNPACAMVCSKMNMFITKETSIGTFGREIPIQ